MKLNDILPEVGRKFDREKVDERMIMLCDGVFAIAMTLLVLDIKLNITGGDINTAISDLLGKILIYIITFFVIARYWTIHRQLMRSIKRMDTIFIRLTFLFLAFVTFFPVVLNMEFDDGQFAQVTILYALVVAGCGFSAQLLGWYALWEHRLIDSDLDMLEIRYRILSGLSAPIITCLSLLLLFIPFVAADPPRLFFGLLLIPVVDRITKVIYNRIKKEHAEEKGQEQQTLVSDELRKG